MLELGGNIYFTAKLGATDGHSFQHLAAVMTGSSQQDYAEMMLGRRPLGGRQPQQVGQGQTRPSGPSQSEIQVEIQIFSKAEVEPWQRSSQV